MEELETFLRQIEKEMKEKDAKIFQIHHKRNRKILEMLNEGKIDNEFYKKLVEYNLADKNLIDMWKKPGYEKLCCMRCVQPLDHKFNTVCKCRIPEKFKEGEFECESCKCGGCGSF